MRENSSKKNNKPQVVERVTKKHYSLLTFVLLICIVELGISAFNNINKNIHYSSKIKGLENRRNEEAAKNEQLKSQIKNFNSEAILESITRNNLKMAGENEILVIIHKPKENMDENAEEEKDLKKKINDFLAPKVNLFITKDRQ